MRRRPSYLTILMTILVVVKCLNGEEQLPPTVQEAQDKLKRCYANYQIAFGAKCDQKVYDDAYKLYEAKENKTYADMDPILRLVCTSPSECQENICACGTEPCPPPKQKNTPFSCEELEINYDKLFDLHDAIVTANQEFQACLNNFRRRSGEKCLEGGELLKQRNALYEKLGVSPDSLLSKIPLSFHVEYSKLECANNMDCLMGMCFNGCPDCPPTKPKNPSATCDEDFKKKLEADIKLEVSNGLSGISGQIGLLHAGHAPHSDSGRISAMAFSISLAFAGIIPHLNQFRF